jgi:hypothetical protein
VIDPVGEPKKHSPQVTHFALGWSVADRFASPSRGKVSGMNRPPPHLTHCRDGMKGKGLVIASALVLNRFPGRSLPEGPCARLSDSGPYVHVDSAEITAARVACRRDGAPTLPGWMGSCGVNGASWAHIRWSLLPITGRVAGGLPTSTGRRRISEPVADGDKYDRQLSVRKRTDRGTACTMGGELTGGRLGLP